MDIIHKFTSDYLRSQHFNRRYNGSYLKKNAHIYNGVKNNACLFPPGINPSNHQISKPNISNSKGFRRTQILFVISFFMMFYLVHHFIDKFVSFLISFYLILIIQYIHHYFNRVPEAFD